MRNTIVLSIVINICTISLMAALYVCYKSIVANQVDIRKDIAELNYIMRNEIVFDIIDPIDNGLNVEKYCDMTLTAGIPLPTCAKASAGLPVKEVKNV